MKFTRQVSPESLVSNVSTEFASDDDFSSELSFQSTPRQVQDTCTPGEPTVRNILEGMICGDTSLDLFLADENTLEDIIMFDFAVPAGAHMLKQGLPPNPVLGLACADTRQDLYLDGDDPEPSKLPHKSCTLALDAHAYASRVHQLCGDMMKHEAQQCGGRLKWPGRPAWNGKPRPCSSDSHGPPLMPISEDVCFIDTVIPHALTGCSVPNGSDYCSRLAECFQLFLHVHPSMATLRDDHLRDGTGGIPKRNWTGNKFAGNGARGGALLHPTSDVVEKQLKVASYTLGVVGRWLGYLGEWLVRHGKPDVQDTGPRPVTKSRGALELTDVPPSSTRETQRLSGAFVPTLCKMEAARAEVPFHPVQARRNVFEWDPHESHELRRLGKAIVCKNCGSTSHGRKTPYLIAACRGAPTSVSQQSRLQKLLQKGRGF